MAKLSLEDLVSVRSLAKRELSNVEIARLLGVSVDGHEIIPIGGQIIPH